MNYMLKNTFVHDVFAHTDFPKVNFGSRINLDKAHNVLAYGSLKCQ